MELPKGVVYDMELVDLVLYWLKKNRYTKHQVYDGIDYHRSQSNSNLNLAYWILIGQYLGYITSDDTDQHSI